MSDGAELKSFNGVWIEIERCIDCHTHQDSTRHVEAKYDHYEAEITNILKGKIPSDAIHKIVRNPGPKAHGINCKKSEYNPYMWVAYAMDQNTRKWQQTQVFRYPRIGAFEVYVNKGKVRKEVFSKLKKSKWPNPKWVSERVLEAVESVGGWEPLPENHAAKGAKKFSGHKDRPVQEISDEELRLMIKKKFTTLIAAFRSFDRNGDGAVNKKEFQIGLKQAGLFLPPELIDRIWKLADTDGTGTLAYQEFARKFAAYKASASMHRHADFKNKGEAQAEKLHGTGAGARQSKQTNIRKDTGDIVYKIDTEKFTEKHEEEVAELSVQQIARTADFSSKRCNDLTPDEIRAFCVQKHGNLANAFRHLTAGTGDDVQVGYEHFMERMPAVLGQKVGALKLNELWKSMDTDFSGFVKLDEFATNKCLGRNLVSQWKGQTAAAPEEFGSGSSKPKRPQSASASRPQSASASATTSETIYVPTKGGNAELNSTNLQPISGAGVEMAGAAKHGGRPESASTTAGTASVALGSARPGSGKAEVDDYTEDEFETMPEKSKPVEYAQAQPALA